MEQFSRFCVFYFGILLPSCFFHYECRKLDGYNFSVYLTEYCPRNETEWKARSTAINCTEKNGYACLPNKNITELLEFCYTIPFIWIEEGVCLYLNKRPSIVLSYNCSQFQFGCPNSSHASFDLFENPECTSIGNGCFLAEPSCYWLTSPAYDQQTTQENVSSLKRHTSPAYNQQITQESSIENIAWIVTGAIVGVFLLILISLRLYISNRKGNQSHKRYDGVKYVKDETSQLIPQNHPDRMESITEGNQTHIRYADRENMEDDVAQPVLQNHPDRMESTEELPADQALIMQWEEDNKLFVETKASNEVEGLIKNQNFVIVTGHTGSGKSTIVHHIALEYKTENWKIKPVRTVMEMIQTINSTTGIMKRKTLFVFDDPIGKESFEEMEYTTWKKYEETLKACLKKYKLLMSCRKYILYDHQVTGFLKDGANIVDISNDQLKLRKNEKEEILSKYALNKNLSTKVFTEIIETEAYFPLLCKLCSSKEYKEHEKLKLFTRPVEVLKKEIKMFRKSFQEKYCAVVLLVLFNNDFCFEDIQESGVSRDKYELALKLCELKIKTSQYTINNAFKTLRGFYVQMLSDNYHFYHDFVMDVTTKVFGKQCPLVIIKYADIGFLRRRVTLKCLNDKSNHFTIHLKDKHIESLAKRLFIDIFGERLLDVVLNPCLKNQKVIDFVINELEKHPEKLSLLLEKKKLQFDTQEVSHASNHFFLSKLTFVSLEETISPLSAIIIFCDTRLTLHCLKILQQKQEYFTGNSLLTSVCCNGSKDLYSLFLKDHVKTSLAEKWKFLYPIHIASAFKNNDVLRELLKNGADVNLKTTNENYWTPLTLAVGIQTDENKENEQITSTQSRRNETIDQLLSHGADINLCKENGVSPLYIACEEGHDDIVQHFLRNGANINICTKNGASPLTIACDKGHERIVDTLVRNGADIQSSMEDGSNPLFLACQKGHANTVNLLLNNKVDANRRLKDGTSPLFAACQEGHDTIVKLLLNKKADTNLCKTNGESPLYAACQKGYENIVYDLLASGADVHICMKNGASPLYIACQKGHDNIVQELLKKGADINKCAADGASPLLVACQYRHEKLINVLLQNGAKPDVCMVNGSSPLITACKYGHEHIVQLLLDKGADINLCNRSGVGPLHISCRYGHENIVQLLLNNGANVNLIGKFGDSPLHIASSHGYDKVVEHLLSKEADINVCDESGDCPLVLARKKGHDTIVKLLKDKGECNKQFNESKAIPL